MRNSVPKGGRSASDRPPDRVLEVTRRLGQVVRSDEVRRAASALAPQARQLGDAVRRAWRQ